MQSVNSLSQQIQMTYERVLDLYQPSALAAVPKTDILPIALKELGVASEELQVALEELTEQTERLAIAQQETSRQRSRYYDMFESAPDALIITSPLGIIEDINRAAAVMFDRNPIFLIGKPLASLCAFEDRTRLRNLLPHEHRAEVAIHFQRPNQTSFEVDLALTVTSNEQNTPQFLRWQLQERQPSSAIAVSEIAEPLLQSRRLEQYCKGETISLDPQMLYLVTKGTVKLTTLSDVGEDILVGLVPEEGVFGASFTSLSIYSAIALTKVDLVVIPVAEMTRSAELSQTLMPRIIKRLQQSERFSTICGHLRVQDRLNQFLQLLKAEMGAPIADSADHSNVSKTWIKIKLTHQEFAQACCTTRVTITRLLGQLQQAGEISFDAQNHLIIKN